MHIMRAIQRATFSKMLLNTNTRQLGIMFFKLTAVTTYWTKAILIFWESITAEIRILIIRNALHKETQAHFERPHLTELRIDFKIDDYIRRKTEYNFSFKKLYD